MDEADRFLEQAIGLARDNVEKGGRPFGAVLVRDGVVIATGVNEMMETGDPTAHAELLAVRGAAQALGTPRLEGCIVYASGHPCPMCLAAMYMAGVREVVYAYSNAEGEAYGLSTAAVYSDLVRSIGDLPLKFVHRSVRSHGVDDLYEMWAARQA
jgi:tRNA(Arg) A34 adenosine deaminase TadA